MTFRMTAEWRPGTGDDAGSPGAAVDEATLGEIAIEIGPTVLTSAEDRATGSRRKGANLTAYRLAEWLVWNWWRLRWEPTVTPHEGARREGWRAAHDLAGIGGGWLWPNVEIHTDGVRVSLAAKPSRPAPTEPLNYTVEHVSAIPAAAFEEGVDRFVEDVLNRLDGRAFGDTDLHTMWRELAAERADRETSFYRRLEACLGFDPDKAEPRVVERLIADGDALGEGAMAEIAADRPRSASELRREAHGAGFEAVPGDGVRTLASPPEGDRDELAAWRVGVDAARRLRRQEGLGDGPLPDRRLVSLYGVRERALEDTSRTAPTAFALDEGGEDRIVLRSRWSAGRRFELARLLADRLLIGGVEPLRPATRAHTYRQKMQRAFAGEFLCPVDSLVEYLDGDYSNDAREDAAGEFRVSPLAVTTILVDNDMIDRDEMLDRSVLAA